MPSAETPPAALPHGPPLQPKGQFNWEAIPTELAVIQQHSKVPPVKHTTLFETFKWILINYQEQATCFVSWSMKQTDPNQLICESPKMTADFGGSNNGLVAHSKCCGIKTSLSKQYAKNQPTLAEYLWNLVPSEIRPGVIQAATSLQQALVQSEAKEQLCQQFQQELNNIKSTLSVSAVECKVKEEAKQQPEVSVKKPDAETFLAQYKQGLFSEMISSQAVHDGIKALEAKIQELELKLKPNAWTKPLKITAESNWERAEKSILMKKGRGATILKSIPEAETDEVARRQATALLALSAGPSRKRKSLAAPPAPTVTAIIIRHVQRCGYRQLRSNLKEAGANPAKIVSMSFVGPNVLAVVHADYKDELVEVLKRNVHFSFPTFDQFWLRAWADLARFRKVEQMDKIIHFQLNDLTKNLKGGVRRQAEEIAASVKTLWTTNREAMREFYGVDKEGFKMVQYRKSINAAKNTNDGEENSNSTQQSTTTVTTTPNTSNSKPTVDSSGQPDPPAAPKHPAALKHSRDDDELSDTDTIMTSATATPNSVAQEKPASSASVQEQPSQMETDVKHTKLSEDSAVETAGPKKRKTVVKEEVHPSSDSSESNEVPQDMAVDDVVPANPNY